jgi:hypothetical protein
MVVVVAQPRRCAAFSGVGKIGIGGRNLILFMHWSFHGFYCSVRPDTDHGLMYLACQPILNIKKNSEGQFSLNSIQVLVLP